MDCCKQDIKKKNKGFLSAIFYGLLPHTFCIGFVVFSVIGATTATAFFKDFLLIPYFFHLLVAISFVFATISAFIYLKRNDCLCAGGIKNKWKYLASLYLITIFVNLSVFFFVFPALANMGQANITGLDQLSALSIKVDIPCSGHAPLIIDELKKDNGVSAVKFAMPNTFEIKYNPQKTSPERITALEIFKTYKATIEQ